MVYFLKCLVILLQSPQPLSHSKYVKIRNSNLAPPIHPIWSHRVHMTQPLPETLTVWSHRYGSRSHRDGRQRAVTCCTLSVPPSQCNRSHRVGLTSALLLIASLRSHRVDAIGATELMFAQSPSTSVTLSCSSRSHRDS